MGVAKTERVPKTEEVLRVGEEVGIHGHWLNNDIGSGVWHAANSPATVVKVLRSQLGNARCRMEGPDGKRCTYLEAVYKNVPAQT